MANLAHLMKRETFDQIAPVFASMQAGSISLDDAQDRYKEILALDETAKTPEWTAFYIRAVARSVAYLPEHPTVWHESRDARLACGKAVWS